jgi:hypothetical protein
MPWQPSKNPQIRDKWRRQVAAWQRSGLSQASFCREQGFSVTSFSGWRRWFDRHPAQLPALVELRLDDALPDPPMVDGQAMWVTLRSGRGVGLRPGFDPASVAQLVTLLEQL